jgi:hypothetical protein
MLSQCRKPEDVHTIRMGKIGHISFMRTYPACDKQGLIRAIGKHSAQGDGLDGRPADVQPGNNPQDSYWFLTAKRCHCSI